jgi:hypothetical protein
MRYGSGLICTGSTGLTGRGANLLDTFSIDFAEEVALLGDGTGLIGGLTASEATTALAADTFNLEGLAATAAASGFCDLALAASGADFFFAGTGAEVFFKAGFATECEKLAAARLAGLITLEAALFLPLDGCTRDGLLLDDLATWTPCSFHRIPFPAQDACGATGRNEQNGW